LLGQRQGPGLIDVALQVGPQALYPSAGAPTDLEQSAAVLNKDGASGTIGTNAVAFGAPGGLTRGCFPDGQITEQPTLNIKASYLADDLQSICQLFSSPYVRAVRADSDFPSLGQGFPISHGQDGSNRHLLGKQEMRVRATS